MNAIMGKKFNPKQLLSYIGFGFLYCLIFQLLYNLLRHNNAFPYESFSHFAKSTSLNFVPILATIYFSYLAVFVFLKKEILLHRPFLKMVLDFLANILILFIVNYSFLFLVGLFVPNTTIVWIGTILNSVFVFLGMEVAYYIESNNNLKKEDEELVKLMNSNQTSEIQNEEVYTKLLDLLKKNDSSFILYFNEIFPDFSQKLSDINPKIIHSEIEFCALLKLKLPTKDIARYKFIEPKTVRNKKYLLRKKLNIPLNVDLYQWFETL